MKQEVHRQTPVWVIRGRADDATWERRGQPPVNGPACLLAGCFPLKAHARRLFPVVLAFFLLQFDFLSTPTLSGLTRCPWIKQMFGSHT